MYCFRNQDPKKSELTPKKSTNNGTTLFCTFWLLVVKCMFNGLCPVLWFIKIPIKIEHSCDVTPRLAPSCGYSNKRFRKENMRKVVANIKESYMHIYHKFLQGSWKLLHTSLIKMRNSFFFWVL